MECMLLPRNPSAGLPKIPYISTERYDGGEFLSYAKRKGIPIASDSGDSNAPPNIGYEVVNNLDNSEKEPLLQTWLFFGLLSEFFSGNASEEQDPARPNQIISSLYDDFLYQDNDKSYVTTKHLLARMSEERKNFPQDRECLLSRCTRISSCVQLAWQILERTDSFFDPRIKASIGVVGELLQSSMNYVYRALDSGRALEFNWLNGYYNPDPKERSGFTSPREIMLSHGWCPSDISRAAEKFKSAQLLHLLGMMDRSHPVRDHSQCDNFHCQAYQITPEKYKIRHIETSCLCTRLLVDNSRIISILKKDKIPLLRFIGGIYDLTIEITESSEETPYTAISHVWADGLGNHRENSLNCCVLIWLRAVVEAIGHPDPSGAASLPGSEENIPQRIWIDTLCCPVGPSEAKQMALKNLRQVYQHASQVLVLDASLQAHKSQEMDVSEKLARIFTSGWMRRLWTLQEGALAKLLYFQFSDCALSLEDLRKQFEQKSTGLRYRIIMSDITQEYLRLQLFFHADRFNQTGPDLNILNAALRYRSVSVASDEVLCIGTLMSLNGSAILAAPIQDHVRTLWSLLAEKLHGIPSQIIFFEDARLDIHGWRWAPASLLTTPSPYSSPEARYIRWKGTALGEPTESGLLVRYSGFHIAQRNYNDGKPRYPWPENSKLPEDYLTFRDSETMEWYQIVDKGHALKVKDLAGDERKKLVALKPYPLHDLACLGNVYVICSEDLKGCSSGDRLAAPTCSGILAGAISSESPFRGIAVKTKRHVFVSRISKVHATIYNAIEPLAQTLRTSGLAEIFAIHTSQNSEEYTTLVKAMKQQAKDLIAKALLENPTLGPAVDSIWGTEFRDSIWTMIPDWHNNDFIGTRYEADQAWVVD